jgi:transcriptional regulator with XRE-family HTH domain
MKKKMRIIKTSESSIKESGDDLQRARLNKETGARLRFFRLLLDKSEKQMASGLNITPYHLRLIENGEKEITQKIIIQLCVDYGINTSWLYSGQQFIFSHPGEKVPFLLPFRTIFAQYSHNPEILEIRDMITLMEIPRARHYLKRKISEAKRIFEKEIQAYGSGDIRELGKEKIVGNWQLAVGKRRKLGN